MGRAVSGGRASGPAPTGTLVGAAFVPGLPHLLADLPAPGWLSLANAARDVGRALRAAGAEALMVISSQWFSVLGLQVQVRPELRGTRVDENWYPYDFGTVDFALRTDVPLADAWLGELRRDGFQARPTDHPHFPIDSGLIVATRLLDPESALPVAQVSLNLYGSPESVEKLGAAALRAAAGVGRKVAVIAIAGLSSAPHKTWIEFGQDRISSPVHERWNTRILDLIRAGKADDALALHAEYAAAAQVDAQLRPLFFLRGACDLAKNPKVHAYAPVWGMGGAVISWLS